MYMYTEDTRREGGREEGREGQGGKEGRREGWGERERRKGGRARSAEVLLSVRYFTQVERESAPLTQHQLVLLSLVVNGGSIEPDDIVCLGQSIATRHTAQDTSL